MDFDYKQTWGDLLSERQRLFDNRTTLETELVEVRNKIAHIDEVLSHLAPLAGVDWVTDENLSQFGLTDAIRFVLRHSPDRLSAADIRRSLLERGYDLSGLTAPMASIYKILARLVDDSGEVEREREESKVYFKWKHPGITDEDIPF